MWRALAAAYLPQLSGYDFKELERRAEQQIERIEIERIRAAQQAFAGTVASQHSKGRTVTVAMDGMIFHRPVRVGDVVSVYAGFGARLIDCVAHICGGRGDSNSKWIRWT